MIAGPTGEQSVIVDEVCLYVNFDDVLVCGLEMFHLCFEVLIG